MADDAQVAAPEGTEGSVPSNDAADATPSPSAPVDRQELLDRLTAMGRERTAENQKVRYLESQLGYAGNVLTNQGQQIQYLQSQMSKQQWQDFDARLAQMSPVDAANERARVAMEYSRSLEQRLIASQQRPPAPVQNQRQETDEEYSTRKANEILAKVNRRHRLSGNDELTIKDMPTDAWEDPETFAAEAGIMAKQRAASKSDDLAPMSQDKVQAMVAKEVARITGAGRGMSPGIAPGEAEPASEEVAALAAKRAESGRLKGPGASIAELRKHREQVTAKIGQ